MTGIRELTEADVDFVLECEPEDVPIEGNAMASGDDDVDAEAEQWVRDQLESGNEWAWCHVIVRARWNGLEGVDNLGCCSYKSEADFRQPGGYYDDMRAEALADLNAQLEDLDAKLDQLKG
jgi:hypothetical protein